MGGMAFRWEIRCSAMRRRLRRGICDEVGVHILRAVCLLLGLRKKVYVRAVR